MTFADAGGTFAGGTNNTVSSNGVEVVVRLNNNLPIVGETIPSGVGSISGIATVFAGIPQILPNTIADFDF